MTRLTRRWALTWTLATASGALAACLPARNGVAGGAGRQTIGPAEVVFHSQTNVQEATLYAERMARFMEQHPQIKVTNEIPAGNYYEKLTVLAAGGTIGDALRTHLISGGPSVMAQKMVQPLDPFIARDKFELGQYYKYAVEAHRRDGKLYGIPFTGHAGRAVLFYNETLLKQRGAGIPDKSWTLEQLVDAAKRATDGTAGTWGYDPTAAVYQTPLATVRAFGGELIDPAGKQSLLTSPPVVAGVTWLYDCFYKQGITPTPPQLSAAGGQPALFTAGKLAAVRTSLSFLSTTNQVKDGFKWFATIHPKGPGNLAGSDSECGSYAMTAASKQPAATWLWIKFITDQESGIRLGEIGGVPGARPDVYGSPRLLKDPVWKVFGEAMQIAQPARIPHNARMQEYAQAIADGVKPLWDGTTTPNQAFFAEWSRKVQVVLDRPSP